MRSNMEYSQQQDTVRTATPKRLQVIELLQSNVNDLEPKVDELQDERQEQSVTITKHKLFVVTTMVSTAQLLTATLQVLSQLAEINGLLMATVLLRQAKSPSHQSRIASLTAHTVILIHKAASRWETSCMMRIISVSCCQHRLSGIREVQVNAKSKTRSSSRITHTLWHY